MQYTIYLRQSNNNDTTLEQLHGLLVVMHGLNRAVHSNSLMTACTFKYIAIAPAITIFTRINRFLSNRHAWLVPICPWLRLMLMLMLITSTKLSWQTLSANEMIVGEHWWYFFFFYLSPIKEKLTWFKIENL